MPRGIGPLTKEQTRRRALSWEVTSSRHQVNRVRGVNGSGGGVQPSDSEDSQRPADRSFHYRDNGVLEYAIEYTPTGKEIRKCVYTPDMSIVEFQRGQPGTVADAGRVSLGRHH